MLHSLRKVLAHVLDRFLQHVHASRRGSLSFLNYIFNNDAGEEGILDTPYSESLSCKKSKTLASFHLSFGHSHASEVCPILTNTFHTQGMFSLFFSRTVQMEESKWRLYTGPSLRSSRTLGWIFMKFSIRGYCKMLQNCALFNMQRDYIQRLDKSLY
jgi:hypothetical protein